MDMGGGLMDFVQRFQALQRQREASDELIKDLLIYSQQVESGLRDENKNLQERLSDSTLDLADATKSRRDLQLRVNQLEARMSFVSQDNEVLKNRNPYVVVLIDGDGLIFKESLIAKGLDGGKTAAYALRNAILQDCGDYASDVEVVAKVVANVGGLAKAMKRDGSLENDADLKDFTLGFTQCMASFDFVDIGYGKERADSKIKELTRWNLRNYNCKQVILGVSHDAGYASFLDEILRDDTVRARVSILEGYPTVRELVATGLNILNLTKFLFRDEKLVDRPLRDPSPPVVISPPLSVLGLSPLPPPSTTPVNSGIMTYSSMVGKASPPPQITLPLPLQPKTNNIPSGPRQKLTLWNPGPRGVDTPLQVNTLVLEAIKKRKDNDKLCNNHYLRGPCAKGNACCFEHKYKPTTEEKTAIAFLARLNPCQNGQDCELDDCIYGHHCPSTINGQCQHPYCKFKPWEHPPGTKFKATYVHLDDDV